MSSPRPLTFALMAQLLDAAGMTVQRVSIGRLHEEVFYAAVSAQCGDRQHEIDARPSDALNLALWTKAPIFVAPEIMDTQSVRPNDLWAHLDAVRHEPAALAGEETEWRSVSPPNLKWPKAPPSTTG